MGDYFVDLLVEGVLLVELKPWSRLEVKPVANRL
jgi:hypothetical protein